MIKRTLFILLNLIFLFPLHGFAADDSLCARVKIEIRQELTLERQAFDAHMRINNGLSHITLQDIDVNVTFADEEGNTVLASYDPDNTEALFFIRLDSMENIEDVEGSGTVQPSTSADIHWLIIPAPGASNGLEQGTLYYVGAKLTYTIGGEEHVTEVTPDYIFVKPMPELMLDYFLPTDVYGDDAFTTEIESPIPFSLGVRVSNNGAGAAREVKIDSAQPEIIDNELGLLVNFVIEGSEVNGEEATDSLMVEFGDIDPNTSGVARWIMTCSLSGQFVEFEAEFSHSDELGGELTSLIEAVNTHFLVRDVQVDVPGRDLIRDFLAKDGGVYRVYESDSVDTVVVDQSASSSLSGSGNEYTLTSPVTAGCMYVQLPDPFSGQEDLNSVVRSDGKVIKEANAWLSKTRGENHEWQYFVNLFDMNTTSSYTLIFEVIVGENHPPVLQFIPDREGVEEQQLSFIVEASDPDGTIPMLSVEPLPEGADFTDQGDGTGIFDWTPIIGQAGLYDITFTASDGELEDSQAAQITICPANDSDNDCMDDDWEMEHFGTLDRDGTGDFDGDGISDRDEGLNDTNPTVSGAHVITITPSPVEIELEEGESDNITMTVTNLADDAITYEVLYPAMETVVTDPEGDLIPETSGQPSVDITGVDAGFTDDMQWMRLHLTFASTVVPELTGSIYLDTDQDAGTGIPAMDDYYGAGSIGYEYLLNFSGAGTDGTVIIEDAAGGDPVVITGVFSNGDTEFTVDIPLTAIGNDDGDINLGVLLSNTESQLDVVPESDYAILSGNGTFIPWLSLSKTSGAIGPGESDSLTAGFNTGGLDEGQYYDVIIFKETGVYGTQVTIPVILSVVNLDRDSDGVVNDVDNCPDTANGPDGGTCSEGTNKGDSCTIAEENTNDCGDNGFCSMDQEDADGDDVGDVCDNCPDVVNSNQDNSDSDNLGNACDNCWYMDNPDQTDDDSSCTDSMPYTSDPECGDVCEAVCGNDLKEGTEVCDGTDLDSEDCISQGYDGGTLTCLNDCSGFDFSNCTDCSNDTVEGEEVCDGTDLGGETCESQGYSGGGNLSCLPDCSEFDVSECIVGDLDGDGVLDDLDNCPDTPNGPDGGTCTEGDTGNLCMNNDDCDFELIEGVCSMDQEDSDDDDVGDVCDNCPDVVNPNQDNSDSDSLGNACDNCWYLDNPDQADTDGSCTDPMPYTSDPGCGDVCEEFEWHIPLQAGWNLIGYAMNEVKYRDDSYPGCPSVPFAMPPDPPVCTPVDSMGDVLSSCEGKYIIVRGFDENGAHTYDPTVPDFINDLDYMGPGYGYQIKMSESCELVLTGNKLGTDATMPLMTNWNLVAYWLNEVLYRDASYPGGCPAVPFAWPPDPPLCTSVDSMGDVLACSIDGTYIIARGFDTSGAHTYDPDPTVPDFINDLDYMGPGYGYQLKMSDVGTLHWCVEDTGGPMMMKAGSEGALLADETEDEENHFTPVAITPVFVSLWGTFKIDGVDAEVGDEVGIFVDGDCFGSYKVDTTGYYGFLHVYGDDPTTDKKDGAYPGDLLTIKIWDISEEVERTLSSGKHSGVGPLTWTSDGDVIKVDID